MKKMIDVDKIARELVEKQVKCPACKSLNLGASVKEFALPRYYESIDKLDDQNVLPIALVQCRDCGYVLFFNASNYEIDK